MDVDRQYLDWLFVIEENEVWCNNIACPVCPGDGSVGITSSYGLTPRLLCEQIEKHATRDHRA